MGGANPTSLTEIGFVDDVSINAFYQVSDKNTNSKQLALVFFTDVINSGVVLSSTPLLDVDPYHPPLNFLFSIYDKSTTYIRYVFRT